MSSKNIFNLLCLIFVLVLSTSCFALQENFNAYSVTQDVVVCSNSVTTNSITIRNTGDVQSYYGVAAEGSAALFTTYSETQFSLNPGETKTIFVYYAPGSSKGNFELDTKIKTGFGKEQIVKHNIESKNCPNIQVAVNSPYLKINPCQPAQFSFKIKNTGDYAETYTFGLKGLESYAALSTNSIFLAPQEEEQVDLFVNPDCSIYGEKELTFQALGRTSQFLAEAKVILDIARNYDYSVSIPAISNVCNYKQGLIPVAFANNVPFTNQYDVVVSGPSWLKQEAKRVELGPMGSGTTLLVAQTENPGSYIIDVKTISLRGEITKIGSQNLTIENCYDSDINIETPADIIVVDHSAQYSIKVKNEGTRIDTYEFEIMGPEWISSNLQKVSVNPKETKTFTLTALPSINATGNYDVTVKATSLETNSVSSDVLKLKVVLPEDAYDLRILPKNTRVLHGEGAVTIELKNTGLLPATYDLTLKGPSWAKLTTAKVLVNPGETGLTYIQTNTKESVESANYEFQLIANAANEVGFSSTFIVKLRSLTVWQEIYVFIIQYWIYLTIAAVVFLILLFIAIFGRRIARRYRNWVLKKREIAKIKAEIAARKKAEKEAQRLIRKAAKKPSKILRRTFGVLLFIIAILLVAGSAVYMTGYAPIVQEWFTPKQAALFEPIIKVDTTGLEAYGNTIIIRGTETTVPIIVKNNYNEDLVFSIETGSSWIKTDTKEIELKANQQETVKLRITPSGTTQGVYKISVSAQLERENKILKESINLNIRQKTLVQDLLDYAYYVGGGIVVLLVVLFIRKITKRKVQKKQDEKDGKIEFSKIRYKPVQKAEISLSKKK